MTGKIGNRHVFVSGAFRREEHNDAGWLGFFKSFQVHRHMIKTLIHQTMDAARWAAYSAGHTGRISLLGSTLVAKRGAEVSLSLHIVALLEVKELLSSPAPPPTSLILSLLSQIIQSRAKSQSLSLLA